MKIVEKIFYLQLILMCKLVVFGCLCRFITLKLVYVRFFSYLCAKLAQKQKIRDKPCPVYKYY